MSLATHVRTLGRGPGRSRSLTQAEAADAMGQMLSPDAAPEAVGALLMLLRMKGETADEIAGFADAARASLPVLSGVDLDWPCYAAGRTRGLPWFLLSARLVTLAGYRVLLHGWNGADEAVRAGLGHAGIPTAYGRSGAQDVLTSHRIAYLPLEHLSPALFALLNLRDTLGLRSCINTVCRMLNPAGAPASVQGVFHPSYRLLQADAAQRLGWNALSVIKGGGGEVERNPSKPIEVFGLRAGQPWQTLLPPTQPDPRKLAGDARDPERLSALWDGALTDPFARDVVLGTAELALDTLGAEHPRALAETLWETRHQPAAA